MSPAWRSSNVDSSFQSKLVFKSVCHFSPAHEHARSSQAFVSGDELLVPYHQPFPRGCPYFSPDLGIAKSNFLSGATIRFDLGLMWESFSRVPGRAASMSRSAPPKSSCSDPNSACLPRSSNEYLPDRRLLRGTLTASTGDPAGSAISCDFDPAGLYGATFSFERTAKAFRHYPPARPAVSPPPRVTPTVAPAPARRPLILIPAAATAGGRARR